jgi:hypothetical protein
MAILSYFKRNSGLPLAWIFRYLEEDSFVANSDNKVLRREDRDVKKDGIK